MASKSMEQEINSTSRLQLPNGSSDGPSRARTICHVEVVVPVELSELSQLGQALGPWRLEMVCDQTRQRVRKV